MCSTCQLRSPLRQLPDRVAVGGREDLLHRLLPGQPELRDMLGRIERRHRRARHQEAEHVLDVVRHVGRVARAPLRPDLVAIGEPPVGQRAGRKAGLLQQLAPRGGLEVRVVRLARAGDGLPEAGLRRPLDQQHVQSGRMDHDQHRFGELERHPRHSRNIDSAAQLWSAGIFRGDNEQAASNRHRRGVGKARRHQQRHQGRGARRGRDGDRRPRRRHLPHRREVRRRMGRAPVAEEGRAALLPALRFGADGRRRRLPGHGRRALVRQGAAQDHRLGRRPLRQGGLPRRAGLGRAPRLLHRARRSC